MFDEMSAERRYNMLIEGAMMFDMRAMNHAAAYDAVCRRCHIADTSRRSERCSYYCRHSSIVTFTMMLPLHVLN